MNQACTPKITSVSTGLLTSVINYHNYLLIPYGHPQKNAHTNALPVFPFDHSHASLGYFWINNTLGITVKIVIYIKLSVTQIIMKVSSLFDKFTNLATTFTTPLHSFTNRSLNSTPGQVQ